MRVGYVTIYDGKDIKQYSGTSYYLAKSIESQGVEIVYIGPLKIFRRYLYRTIEYFYKTFLGKLYQPERNKKVLKHYARQIIKKVREENLDVLFSPSTIPLSMVDTDIPMVVFSDAVFAGLHGFYNSFKNVCRATIQASNIQEQEILSRCAMAVFSSEWAAKSAMNNYFIPSGLVRVLSYGANVKSELSREEVRKSVEVKKSPVCKLLFMGVDWERKGGNVALAVAQYLHERNFNVELTLVGTTPPRKVHLPSYVKSLGFISKSTPAGEKRIHDLFLENHFLILPTVADCTPIVFAEANSYGVPCLTRNVGGIPSIITDHVNGKKFDLHAPIKEYADFIEQYFSDYDRYTNLAMMSHNEYTRRLNWKSTGRKIMEILKEVTSRDDKSIEERSLQSKVI